MFSFWISKFENFVWQLLRLNVNINCRENHLKLQKVCLIKNVIKTNQSLKNIQDFWFFTVPVKNAETL